MLIFKPLIERRTYRELVFLACGIPLAGLWLGLLLAGWISAGVLAVTPLLVPVLIGFRGLTWAGARLEAALAGSLLGVEVQPPPLRAGAAGYWGRIRGILGEAAFWRQQVYLALRMVLGFGTGIAAVVAPIASVGFIVEPITYRWSNTEFGSWHVDSLPRALLFVPAGLVGLVVSAWLIRGFAAMWARLAASLLGGSGEGAQSCPDPASVFRVALRYDSGFFAGVNLITLIVWALTAHAYFWPEWTLLPLGLVLAVHAWGVFVLDRVRTQRALVVHAGTSALLELFFVAVWSVTTRAYFWPVWPLLAFGIVVAVHAVATYRPWADRAVLTERIGVLTATRAGAVDVAETELRRIERDLHDGAQARLVALGMSLGLAEQKLAADPEGARALLAEARLGAGEALRELRDLARGIHPPVLSDRGLEAALAALVARSPLPVGVAVDLGARPPASVETAAYFVAAEALANAIKHAGASRIDVRIGQDATALTVEVADDGAGGADPSGNGLAGIRRRVEALDGTLAVESPAGGPTIVRAVMPCGS
jgi:signal transduction histidine kinase